MNRRRFKGTDHTFVQFPQRLQHILTETIHNTTVECVVFPAYEVYLDGDCPSNVSEVCCRRRATW